MLVINRQDAFFISVTRQEVQGTGVQGTRYRVQSTEYPVQSLHEYLRLNT